MAFGIDYVTGPPVADMKSAGVTFVCRYLSFVNSLTQVKLLTPGEAKALSAAGISIVSNYEWYANRPLEGFTSGVQDTQIAASQHQACGGPADRPIYFSVDIDVAGSQVADYFKGVASVIGKARTGAYGSYRVLKYLFDADAIAYGWQAAAWSYGAWEPRCHIQQYANGMNMSGHSVDYDRSVKSDFGQWRVKTMIDLSNPTVASYFAGQPNGWWLSKRTKTSAGQPIYIHGEILKFYCSFGNALCGLTWLGLPVSNEISLGGTSGATRQHFENACIFYDPAHEFDSRPGEPGARVYLAHLYSGPGVDPKVLELEAELAAAKQPAGIDPAKVVNFQTARAIQAHQITQAAQALETALVQPIQ